jgi:uncharacterized protein (DUF2237 family)
MKRRLLLLVAVGIAVFASVAAATISKTLAPVGGSGVHGRVTFEAVHEGTLIKVHVEGLKANETYTSFYYDGSNCHDGPDDVGTFRSSASGVSGTSATSRTTTSTRSTRYPSGWARGTEPCWPARTSERTEPAGALPAGSAHAARARSTASSSRADSTGFA